MTDLNKPPFPPQPPATPPQGGFDFNYPTIVGLLYLSSFLVGITGLVGVVLAYVWKGEARDAWEASHYEYLINTFWIGFIGTIIGVILSFVLIGIPILLGVVALTVVRSVLSLVRAQRREPMPNPGTLLA